MTPALGVVLPSTRGAPSEPCPLPDGGRPLACGRVAGVAAMTAVPPDSDDEAWLPFARVLWLAIPHPRRCTTRELVELAGISSQRATQALAWSEGHGVIEWCRNSGTWGRIGDVAPGAPDRGPRMVGHPGAERKRKRRQSQLAAGVKG